MYAIEQIGIMCPILFIFITVYFLRKQSFYLGGYFVFLLINELLNNLLKGYIREKRPSYDEKEKYNSIFDGIFEIKANLYGMPSSHMQGTLFSCVYLYCVIQNNYILLFQLLLVSITFYYRYTSKKHTQEQLIAGCLIGSIMGYLSYLATKQYVYHKSIFGEKLFSL